MSKCEEQAEIPCGGERLLTWLVLEESLLVQGQISTDAAESDSLRENLFVENLISR